MSYLKLMQVSAQSAFSSGSNADVLCTSILPEAVQRTNTLPKFLFPVAGLATPVDLKLKLIPILQHMHHDASLASSSRQLLQQLVTSYPSTKMVIVTLHTFTLLAASSLVDIPKQVILPN